MANPGWSLSNKILATEHALRAGLRSKPWAPDSGSARTIRPDIVVTRDDNVAMVIDTKWKRPTNGRPSSGDLQQMFAYNELFGCERSVLLYPNAGDATATRGTYRDRSHGCHTAFLSVVKRGRYRPDVAAGELGEVLGVGVGLVAGQLGRRV